MQHVVDRGDRVVRAASRNCRTHEVLRLAVELRAVADHRQEVHVVRRIVRQVRDRTERRLTRYILAQQQRYRAITEQHRLNHERRFGSLHLELIVSELVVLAHASDFAEAVVFRAEQRSNVRSVCFRHQHDGHLARVRCEIPLRNFHRLQHH